MPNTVSLQTRYLLDMIMLHRLTFEVLPPQTMMLGFMHNCLVIAEVWEDTS